ncbi:MAG: hypothetical protein ABEL97_11640 [Salinibacter sp.]
MRYLSTLLSRSRALSLVFGAALALLGLAACDSGGSMSGASPGTLAVNFQTTSTSSSSSATSLLKSAHDSVVVQGANGDELKITDIRFIVEEFELGGQADSLDFEAPPSFLDLPLNGTEFASADTADVPVGTYTEFEFAVDNLEPDEDDTQKEQQRIQDLLNRIREEFPNVPKEASMIVVGTFTPADGDPKNFTSYIEAEIEVEREFEQNPLEVTSDGLSRSLTVKLDPSTWFKTSEGGVRNLAQYQSTDDLLEIEKEFENGVVNVEIGGGNDDDGEDDGSDGSDG